VTGLAWGLPILLLGGVLTAAAQERPVPASGGVEIVAGMGVCAINAPDVTDWINNTTGGSEQVQSFTTAVEFFGAAGVRISDMWRLKVEYAYVLTSYNRTAQLGPAEFFVWIHMPSVLVEYVIADEGLYLVKAGMGAGYHFGGVEESYAYLDTRYTAQGIGIVAELEGNTALSEHLFVYLGVTARWEALGELEDPHGGTAGGSAYIPAPTMQMFGFGARLGMSYYF
jgi:hypothetical protein